MWLVYSEPATYLEQFDAVRRSRFAGRTVNAAPARAVRSTVMVVGDACGTQRKQVLTISGDREYAFEQRRRSTNPVIGIGLTPNCSGRHAERREVAVRAAGKDRAVLVDRSG